MTGEPAMMWTRFMSKDSRGKKKPQAKDQFALSKRKQAALDRRSARLMELGELEDPSKREMTADFSPAALKTDVLRALNLEEMARRSLHRPIPEFHAGSVLRVTVDIGEGKTREVLGLCIAKSNRLLGSNFTIRNSIAGVGFELQFESYSPSVKKIEVLELARRRRAKLYYLRDRPVKESTISDRFQPVPIPDGPVPVKKAARRKRKAPPRAKIRYRTM